LEELRWEKEKEQADEEDITVGGACRTSGEERRATKEVPGD